MHWPPHRRTPIVAKVRSHVPRPDIEAYPAAIIDIGNAGTVGSCPEHNPHYNFNDAALPIGASLFA
jgi:hypothetical protein